MRAVICPNLEPRTRNPGKIPDRETKIPVGDKQCDIGAVLTVKIELLRDVKVEIAVLDTTAGAGVIIIFAFRHNGIGDAWLEAEQGIDAVFVHQGDQHRAARAVFDFDGDVVFIF